MMGPKIIVRFNSKPPVLPVRVMAENSTDYNVCVQAYVEAAVRDDHIVTSAVTHSHDELEGIPATTPYLVDIRWWREGRTCLWRRSS